MLIPSFVWNDAKTDQGLLIPLVLEPADPEDQSQAITNSEARSFLEKTSELPGFTKTVYAMSNRREPNMLKIGHSRNAFDRMRKSASDRTLGRIRKADRIEHLVLICLNVPARTVETRLHHLFRAKRIETEYGREWFQIPPSDLLDGLKVLASAPAIIWLPDPKNKARARDQLHTVLYGAGKKPVMMLAELGDINFVCRSEDTLQVHFTIWCPIKHEHGDPLPMVVIYPPLNATEEQKKAFADDIRKLEPSCDQEILHVYEKGGYLYPIYDDQRIDHCVKVGFVFSNGPGDPPLALNEWIEKCGIYKVDFSIKFDILDTFDIQGDGAIVLRERVVLN